MLVKGRARFQRLGASRAAPCEGAEGMIWLCPSRPESDGLAIRGGPVELLHIHFTNGHDVCARARAFGLDPPVFALAGGFRDALIESIARTLLSELEEGSSVGALFADAAASTLEAYLLRRYSRVNGEAAPAIPARGALSLARLDRALSLIEERLSGELALPELAAAANLSLFHFARAFKAATGLAPHRYILDRRVERAREMLKTDQPTLSEIADRCGFASQPHMTHVFKRATGLTPGAFRTAARSTTGAKAFD